MDKRVGRNDLCTCGSGKKYKRCCMGAGTEPRSGEMASPRFLFEPGTYGAPGEFLASIACLKEVSSIDSEYHFVLVRPDEVHVEERDALRQAEDDLDAAFRSKGPGGSDVAVANSLRGNGYVSVSDFQVVREGEKRKGR